MTAVKINGTTCERQGNVAAPAIVLIHGLGLNRACWQWMVPALLSAKYQVITYDLFGHGDSITPSEKPSLSMFADQICTLLDHFELPRAAIVGFSLGGMIARKFAQEYPEKTAAMGVLFSPHTRSKDAQKAIQTRVEQAKTQGPAATVGAAISRWFTADHQRQNPDQMDLVRNWVLANDIGIYHQIYDVFANSLPEVVDPSPPIAAPSLVLTADQDFGNGPEMAQAIYAEIPNAELHILPDLRHMAMAENPNAVNSILLQFLDKTISQEPSI